MHVNEPYFHLKIFKQRITPLLSIRAHTHPTFKNVTKPFSKGCGWAGLNRLSSSWAKYRMLLAGKKSTCTIQFLVHTWFKNYIFGKRIEIILSTTREKERKRAKEDAYLLQMLSLFKVDYILHEKEYDIFLTSYIRLIL